jgi:hypothetical protein
MKKWNIEQKIVYTVIFLFAVFFLLPFALFGTNSVITIHDNLDQMIPYYKMYHDNGLFFKFDSPTKGFSEMSTLFYGHSNFSLTPLLYSLFYDFTAYTINTYICIFLGFFSMYLLLKKIGNIDSVLIFLLSLCYAILPVGPNLGICVSTLPLIIVIFIHFISQNKFSWKILLILFYPFFSSFTMTGIFILGFWFFGLIILGIKNKKINPNLLIGFVLLCIGYILVDLRLFYVMFILKTPLNRSVYNNLYPVGIIAQIKLFLVTLKKYCMHGHFHASSFQRKIIIPLALFVSVFCLFMLIRKIKNQSGTMIARIRTAVAESSIYGKQLFIFEFTVFIFSSIAALYDSGLLNGFIVRYIPILSGFNWGRVWIFNRVLWYAIFVLCLQFVSGISEVAININTGSRSEKIKLPSFLPRLSVWVLVCIQLLYISLTNVYYNDQIKTWFNEIVIKTGVAKKFMPNRRFDKFISYKEFFSADLFEKIKKDISYSGEKVVAFGYHPSVLMYNGFNCIDGYNNAYPLSYMRRFRTLIAPEFVINQKAMEFYDSWGAIMYLYNSELGYQPTRNKDTSPVKLNIDMDVFKNDFEGRYILSRAEISNSDILGLDMIKRYNDDIYAIYLYQTR